MPSPILPQMPSSKLLITGATGFIGFRVLLEALTAGWRVRITARDATKLAVVLRNTHVEPFASTIETAIIPNILAGDAYSQALSDITHVIHAATPLPFPTENPKQDIIEPALQGTLALLHTAVKFPLLRRIVITSSLVSNIPYPPNDTLVTPSSRVCDPTPEELSAELDFFTAYRYSKILSLNAIDSFRNNRQAHFDIVNVIPGFVHGANLLATEKTVLKGSNRLLLVTLLGQQLPAPRLAGAAHIEDVARVHLHALSENTVPWDSKIDLAISTGVTYNDAWSIVQSAFPKAVESGVLKQGGQPSLSVNYDVSDTLDRCKMEMKTYRQMVEETVDQYLRLQNVEAS